MVSLFYDCNECREDVYQKENTMRSAYQADQQAIVDQQIAENLGLDVQASNLSRLAKRVINSLGSDLLPTNIKVVESAKQKLPTDYLLQAIQSGKLSQLFDQIKAVPKSRLSKKAQIIQDDLKNNQTVKDLLNEMVETIVNDNTIAPEAKPAAIKQEFIDIAAGGDASMVNELVDRALETTNDVKRTKKVKKVLYNMINEIVSNNDIDVGKYLVDSNVNLKKLTEKEAKDIADKFKITLKSKTLNGKRKEFNTFKSQYNNTIAPEAK